jgi:DNA-binding XRE family transcriptional regulator
MNIAELRAEMGVSQEEFAALIGLSSKGNVSIIERENRCGLRVALKIEQLSEGRVDAASLNDEVRLSRHGLDHVPTDTSGTDQSSPGSSGQISPDHREINAASGGAVLPPVAEGVAAAITNRATPEAAR